MYCAYIYLDPSRNNEPFYVGMGKDKARAYYHLRRKDKHKMTNRIQKMLANGVMPIVQFLCEDVEKDVARQVEIDNIAKYGRDDLGTGPLLNLTPGGDNTFTHGPGAKKKIGEASRARKRQPFTPEQSVRLGESIKANHLAGKYKDVYDDPERSAKLAEAAKSKWDNAPLLTCQHCGKQMKNWIVFPRWHNDNCKLKGP